jgi:hypothetical protein
MAMLKDKGRYAEMARQVKGYKWVDGLLEVEGGLYLICWGFFNLFQTFVSRLPLDDYVGNVTFKFPDILVPFVLAAVVLIRPLVITPLRKKLQRRVTYPRTGYVDYEPKARQTLSKPFLVALVFLLFMAYIALMFVLVYIIVIVTVNSNFNMMALLLIVLGSGFGIGWLYLGRKLAIPRFYFVAGLALVLGLALCFFCVVRGDFYYLVSGKSESYYAIGDYYMTAFADFFVGLGVAEFGLGWLTFRRYLKNNPLPVTSEQG